MALTDNIITYWKCDTNGSFPDATGNGHTGTINGATYTSSGKINGAYSYVTNDYVSFSNIALTGAFTISAWIYKNAYTGVYLMFASNSSSNLQYMGYRNSGVGAEQVVIKIGGTGDTGELSFDQRTITSGWHHIVWVRSSGGTLKCYYDGSQDTNTFSNSSTLTLNQLGRFYTGTYYANGVFDEIGIWSRELSSTEVTELYNSGTGFQYPFTPTGWDNKINSITTYSKINGIDVTNIVKVNGI